jgi:pSer/pThr/pTyr-binding forkhead associated (FHA) protein
VLREGVIATLGRLPSCNFILDDPSVSRRHAELRLEDCGIEVSDLGSRNGTFVEDVRVRRGRVLPDQVVRFGDITFTVATVESTGEETEDPKETVRRRGQRSHPTEDALSDAQRRVFELLLEGLPEKTMAKRLSLSQHTIHNHMRAILRRFGVHSRAQLMARVMSGTGNRVRIPWRRG